MKLFSDFVGISGSTKISPDDFIVEELPAYTPSGTGEHTMLFVEKRGLTTEELLVELCRVANVSRNDAGVAGMKDRQAVTRQWVSLPGVEVEKARTFSGAKWRVLDAGRHGNKLKTGHLRGNRFHVVVRGVVSEALSRSEDLLSRLRPGMPNFFGAQRFGARGDNASRGRALLDGTLKQNVGRGERRLLVSALQADLFNRYLEARLREGLVRSLVSGDVLRKRDSGGLFTPASDEEHEAQARLDQSLIDITGPMFGSAMRKATNDSAKREEAILREAGLSEDSFAKLGPIAEGTRRPLLVPVDDATVQVGEEPQTLRLSFVLPPGAYATVLVEELTRAKSPT